MLSETTAYCCRVNTHPVNRRAGTKKTAAQFPRLPLVVVTRLLLQQVELLIRAIDPVPLRVLAAVGQAAAGVVDDHAAVEVEECPGAVAVLDGFPLVVAGGTEAPLDEIGALGSRSALHDDVL